MTIRHPSAAEARLLSLREPEPRFLTYEELMALTEPTEPARNALATYLRRWHALTRWYADGGEFEVCEEKWKRMVMWPLYAEIYLLDPQAARVVVREGGA